MEALTRMFEDLKFEYVQTYVQSGNVIFSTKDADFKLLGNKIQNRIKETFGFEVPVIILDVDTLNGIIENNPFAKDNVKDPAFCHVTFLADAPTHVNWEEIVSKASDGEDIYLTEKTVYLYCPNGYGKTKLNNNYLERKLCVQATTRNWKTVIELSKLAKQR